MEGIMEQISEALKAPSPLPADLLSKAWTHLHTKGTSKDLLRSLHAIQFFEKYLATRLSSDPTPEEALLALSMLIRSESYFMNSVLSDPTLEPALISIFTTLVPKVFSLSPPFTEAELTLCISDLIQFFIISTDRPRDTKLSQHLLNHATLPACLHLSKQGMKQLLLQSLEIVPQWKKLLKNAKESYTSTQATFIPLILESFWKSLAFLNANCDLKDALKLDTEKTGIQYNLVLCQNVLKLMVTLVHNPVTSLYIKAILHDNHVLTLLKLAKVMESPFGALLDKQRDLLGFYMGCALQSKEDRWNEENQKLGLLFKVMYKHFGDRFSKTSTQFVGKLNSRENLEELLGELTEEETIRLCIYLGIPRPSADLMNVVFDEKIEYADILKEIIKNHYDDSQNQHTFAEIVESPLYPTEEILWDLDELPYKCHKDTVLAIPYLSYSFSSFEDLLSRLYWIHRLDAAYYIRENLESIIKEIKPQFGGTLTEFTEIPPGAAKINRFSIKYVKPPLVGMKQPAEVHAEIEFSLKDVSEEHRAAWENLQPGEALFMISFSSEPLMIDVESETFQAKYSVKAVRGCEVSQVYTEGALGVLLDPFQYRQDADSPTPLSFHLLVRIKEGKTKFLNVLKSIRDLARNKAEIPEFLDAIIVKGSHSEGKVNEDTLNNLVQNIFANEDEFKENVLENENIQSPVKDLIKPPAKFSPMSLLPHKLTKEQAASLIGLALKEEQISIVKGVPHSGKTLLSLILAAGLVKANPQERVLLLTNTKESLKIMFKTLLQSNSIQERYLVALGIKDDVNKKVLSKTGRVDHLLTQRLIQLHEVKSLANSLNIQYAEEYTCESAIGLFQTHIMPKWEEFLTNIQIEKSLEGEQKDAISRLFPFTKYFEKEHGLFTGDYVKDIEIAKQKWEEINEMFKLIKEARVFEIIRDQEERENYIISTHAKIIGITTSFASTHREELSKMKLNYTTAIVDNAGTSPLWETVLALTLSKKIKRVVLVGDANQVPASAKNEGFKGLSSLNRTLFEVCMGLKVPEYDLGKVFDINPVLTELYKAKYKELSVVEEEKILANAGFAYTYQWVDVVVDEKMEDENAVTTFSQLINIPEAEYVAATFLYMCVIGYSPKDIAILTGTKEQQELIKEIIETKGTGIIPELPTISTIGKFQGLSKKYLLVSLVRNKSAGPFKNPRRLSYMTTRALNGLYIFGNSKVYTKTGANGALVKQVMSIPLNLLVVPAETYPSSRPVEDVTPASTRPIASFEEMYELVNDLIKVEPKVQQYFGQYKNILTINDYIELHTTCQYSINALNNIENGEPTLHAKLGHRHKGTFKPPFHISTKCS
eukprot:TRINITY_DN64516_c1_g1_i1.p1 TRINITY_DN64516_c1_g1~~TRINITY_DN64516_c1_g1_i1.p1  ORF type:complete len:1359 (-),score=140.25 TRINITY_DN64516_c1_g1_i1:2476-6480(-)